MSLVGSSKEILLTDAVSLISPSDLFVTSLTKIASVIKASDIWFMIPGLFISNVNSSVKSLTRILSLNEESV